MQRSVAINILRIHVDAFVQFRLNTRKIAVLNSIVHRIGFARS